MGKLIVISGPSGVGKGTVVKAMMAKEDNLFFSVSATTRPPDPARWTERTITSWTGSGF